jgi:outer membrane protein TolC
MFVQSIPELPTFAHAAADTIDTEVELIPVGMTADHAIAATADAEAVYLTPLQRMSGDELDRLLEALNDRAIPSFSLLGEAVVRRGALAGLRRGTDVTRLARRVALNVQRILHGEDAGSLPVVLDQPEKLLINMTTAQRIGFNPSWLVVLEADLLQPGGPWGHPLEPETLNLSDAVHEAIRANLSLSVADRRVDAGRENIRFARSLWKPRIDATAGGLVIDADRAAASFGTQPERSWFGGVQASQLIFADDVNANIVGAVEGQSSLEWNRESARLDVALQAATAFLAVLRAQSLEQIEFDNMQLTESNLELARRREAVGFSGPADVYRWESALATSRANRLAAHSQVHSAFARLNQVLNRGQERQYHLEAPDLADPELITGFGRLNPFIQSWAGFELFREFSVLEGLADAPELASIDALIGASRRERQAASRAYWAPKLSVFGEFQRVFSESGAGSSDVSLGGPLGFSTADRDDWSVGLSASLPLYAGSARRARLRQSSEELLGLETERRSRSQQIELRIRLALFDVSATFTAIPLAEQAAASAHKNLELVTDSYSRGVVSVIQLLDAQNAALVAEQFATNAIYDFLLDLMELQRATSDFDFFRSAAGREAWFERLSAFFEQAGFPVRSRER